MKKSRLFTRSIVALLCFCFGLATIPLIGSKPKMADLPSHVGMYLYIAAHRGPLDSPDVTDPKYFTIYYDDIVNGLVILGDDDGIRYIPTLSNQPASIPQTGSALLLDSNGEISTVYDDTNLNPSFEIGIHPIAARMPQSPIATPRAPGDLWGIETVGSDDGTIQTGQDILKIVRAPHLLAEDVVIDLNTGLDQNVYTAPAGYRAIITDVLWHDPSHVLANVEGKMGWNAGVDDVIASAIVSRLSDVAMILRLPADQTSFQGTSGSILKYKNTTLEGAAYSCKCDVIGYLKPN